MLDEWRPLLCPFDVTMIKGCYYFDVFLPTILPPEHHDKGFRYVVLNGEIKEALLYILFWTLLKIDLFIYFFQTVV